MLSDQPANDEMFNSEKRGFFCKNKKRIRVSRDCVTWGEENESESEKDGASQSSKKQWWLMGNMFFMAERGLGIAGPPMRGLWSSCPGHR
jgi:hypothetical protein